MKISSMIAKPEDKKIVQCTIVGDGMVGKTAMALSFSKQQVPQDYTATVFENYAGCIAVAGEHYTVSIFDSAGQHDYDGLRAFTYKDSEVFLVCYSVVDRESFRNVKEFWVPEAKNHMKRKRPIILVGSQIDMRDTRDYDMDKPVSLEEGESLAREIGADDFIECSSVEQTGVKEIFESAVMSALKYRKKKANILNRILKR